MITELIGTAVSSILSGGATGLLGIVITKFFESRKQAQDLEVLKLNMQNAVDIRRIELESQERLATRSAEEREAIASMDAVARETEAQERSLNASYAADRATYSAPSVQEIPAELLKGSRFARVLAVMSAFSARMLLLFVDFTRGMIRPGMTIYTMYLLTCLMLWVQLLFNTSKMELTPPQILELVMQVVGTITYLSVSLATWWFGLRPASTK